MNNTIENNSGSNDETLKPEKLYRAFTVSVNDLSLELLQKPLIPGSGVDLEQSTMKDGNELGVYMTTNETMANTAYAHSRDSIECPRYNSGYGVTNVVELPKCGVTVEIDTAGLDIRRPKITPRLMGVYNNGFDGDEWIADEIPPSNYKVVRLTLSIHPTDSSRVIKQIEDSSDLINAIGEIKTLYAEKLSTAEEFVEFLKGLDDKTRLNEFSVKRAWENHQKIIFPVSKRVKARFTG